MSAIESQGNEQPLIREAHRCKHRRREQLRIRDVRGGKGQGIKPLLPRSSPLQTPMQQLLLREVRRCKCLGNEQLLVREAHRCKHRSSEQLSIREARGGKGQGIKSLLSRSSPLQTPMQ